MFVATLLLKGGLNHVMLRFLLLVLLLFGSCLYSNVCSYWLSFRAAWYTGLTLLNADRLEEMFTSLLLMDFGMFFVICGG